MWVSPTPPVQTLDTNASVSVPGNTPDMTYTVAENMKNSPRAGTGGGQMDAHVWNLPDSTQFAFSMIF